MYQYDVNSGNDIGGFTRKVPRKSKRYSLNRKALEKKRYPGSNTVSRSTLLNGDLACGAPKNVSTEQTDSSSASQFMSCVPLPPSISQEHFLGIIGELNKAFMKNNCNDASTSETNPQMVSQFSNNNDTQSSKFIEMNGISAPIAQVHNHSISTNRILCASQNSQFAQSRDTFGLRQLDNNINSVATIPSQNVYVGAPGIINSNANYIPHGDTSSNLLNGGVPPCISSPMIPRTTIRPAPPVPQGMCTAVPTNYPCVDQNGLPYVPAACAMFVERTPQQNHVWNGSHMPAPPPPPPPPSMMEFWATQGITCNVPFVQNIPLQDANLLPKFPTLNYTVPYPTELDKVPGYQTLW